MPTIETGVMVSPRLGIDKKSSSPSELAVAALQSQKRADSMIDRVKFLLCNDGTSEEGHSRLFSLESEGVKLMVAGLRAGAFGGAPIHAETVAAVVHEAGEEMSACASAAVQYLVACADVAKLGGLPFRAFFRESVLTAIAAKRLGESVGFKPTLAFGMGLLQNVGCLALACQHGSAYAMTLQAGIDSGEALPVLERQAFKIDHTQAGLAVLIYRGYDACICEAAAFHHGSVEKVSRSARLAAAAHLVASQGDQVEAREKAAGWLGVPFGVIDLAVSECRSAQKGLSVLTG